MVKILTSPLFFIYYVFDIVVLIYRFFTIGGPNEKYYEQNYEATAPIWLLQIAIANFLDTFSPAAGISKVLAEIIFIVLAIPFTWGIVRIVLVGSLPNIKDKFNEDNKKDPSD